ncbi:hypothetical protein GEV01_29580 [Rugamonas sp. FT103W]|uniref:Uncharacterized protein n=1 Tax=Rugamonas rivuli TaxID=2743358 RepID=A0A843SNN9_9BURK|nr:hypothetical protein [Rugamonas rivuli]
MSSLFARSTLAPAWLCRDRDILLYLAPSLVLALLVRALSARHPFFWDGQEWPQFSIPDVRPECSR